jgi:3,4-dihydroxy 2-butanone 4-phosphate synthase/GTP cyclohydrolase II
MRSSGQSTRHKLVERIGEFPVSTEIGNLQGYALVTPFDQVHHMAFVHGQISDGRNVTCAASPRGCD